MNAQALKPAKFYKDIEKFEVINMTRAKYNASIFKNQSKRMPSHLLGPTEFWGQFRKQADALETAKKHCTATDTVCSFVYQNEDGFREFIVAHPEVYWWYDKQRPPEERCSYEIIPEDSPCWLYFDLEFQKDLNPDNDGPRMTATLIKIFCAYLLKYYDISCEERNIVNLDSTREEKFSRHLIFCIKDIAFRSNHDVGRLVKGVCGEIEDYLENSNVFHDILSHYERKHLDELFVKTDRKTKIFVDTGVYTRNRHFRIYQSTKWGKLSNFKVAPESKHEPSEKRSDKELAIFLDSLISYFPDKKNLVLLEMNDAETVVRATYSNRFSSQASTCDRASGSKCPELDEFVRSLVKPGKIRLIKEFNKNKLLYDIIGYRYCANINRQHKSNHIYWIADLERKILYQKCHDEDCADFVSKPVPIPQEICFKLDDEFDDLLLSITEPDDVSANP